MRGFNDRTKAENTGYKPKLNSELGSVTIYFIVVTAAFVLLTALLIDYARVAAFRHHTELAVKSGVRSTLSSFDPFMYEQYGLFVRGGESAALLFRETLEGHISPSGGGLGGDVLSLMDIQWGETDITESRPLANHDVFRRQILEEMKYKAPIDLSIEMVERFRGLSGAMEEASATVNLLEKMRKAYERRERAMDDVLANQSKSGDAIQQFLRDIVPYPSQSLYTQQSAGEVNNIEDATLKYEDYVSKRLEDEARMEAQRLEEEEKKARADGENRNEDKDEHEETLDTVEGPIHGIVIAAYESGIQRLAVKLNEASARVRMETEKAEQETNALLQEAKEANEQMRKWAAEAKLMPSSSMEEASSDQSPAVAGDKLESLGELRQTAEELVLEVQYFEEYAAEISLQKSRGLQLAGESASFGSLILSLPGSTGRGQALLEGAETLQSTVSEYLQAYGKDGSVCLQRDALLQAHRSHDSEVKEQEQEATAAWEGARSFLGALTGLSGSSEENEQFEQVTRLFQDNKDWNQVGENREMEEERSSQGQAEGEQQDDPFIGRNEAMTESSSIMSALQDSFLSSRDQLFFSEYTIGRLSHYDPTLVKEILQGGEAHLSIDQQEAEYILYGINNPSSNIAAAYGEIFGFRLAIRTMEGLIENRAMGHPLLVLAAALVYGIRNALLDMNLLIQNGKIQLSKYVKVDTIYTDYLRLFLLVHGGTSNHVARTIAVIERASGLSFHEAYTYASAEGTASVKLWFFPGLLKVMERYGNLGGTVKGSRYEATYTADSSYQ